MTQRASGVLLHPTSLPNSYPIGDLGPAATAFADFLVESGQRWWQMLPVGPTGEEHSPYESPSAFGGNPLLLSPDPLVEQGLLGRLEVEPGSQDKGGAVRFQEAAELKLRWLRRAFQTFERDGNAGKQSELAAFVRAEAFWLEDLSLFLALQDDQGTSGWTRWAEGLRTRQPAAMDRARKELAEGIRYHQFVQWQFSLQWKALRAYCASKGLGLIGDVPLFVGHQSADEWAHPELFKLDTGGNPTVVAGVPPDAFCEAGQLWHVPVYRWEALQAQHYRWWIERLRTAHERFDLNRLDHFIGFVRTYEVPAAAATAANGTYQPAGGAHLFEAARAALGALPFIGDDLGATTPEVAALLDQLQIPGTRVLQFEFGSTLEGQPDSPERPPATAVVYTGTHDTDTTAGWYQSMPIEKQRALQVMLGANAREIVWAMIREALASRAGIAIIPVQDLLELGSEARMNRPGTAKDNWRWRLKDGALNEALAGRLRRVSAAHRRLRSAE